MFFRLCPQTRLVYCHKFLALCYNRTKCSLLPEDEMCSTSFLPISCLFRSGKKSCTINGRNGNIILHPGWSGKWKCLCDKQGARITRLEESHNKSHVKAILTDLPNWLTNSTVDILTDLPNWLTNSTTLTYQIDLTNSTTLTYQIDWQTALHWLTKLINKQHSRQKKNLWIDSKTNIK